MNGSAMANELAAVRELDRLWIAVTETGDPEARERYRVLRPLVWAAVTRPVVVLVSGEEVAA